MIFYNRGIDAVVGNKHMKRTSTALGSFLMVTVGLLGGCGNTVGNQSAAGSNSPDGDHTAGSTVIQAVAAENEYGDVIRQVGGQYVNVSSIMTDPSTDPHTYEASAQDASLVSRATLVVQNGLGYDEFMNKLESASPNPKRTVIDVANALGYKMGTVNPHIWYKPDTMARVAQLVADELSKQLPSERDYFQSNARKFKDSLQTWQQELNEIKHKFPNTPVAVTEPVADYLLESAGMNIKTPWSFQSAIMNGVDPSPQDVEFQENLFKLHQIKVFVYNRQAVTDVTKMMLRLAEQYHIPVVGVYETMPQGKTFQTWMESETQALRDAIVNGKSTESIS
jgi:zinc/manganese transport system substrate-binding protein